MVFLFTKGHWWPAGTRDFITLPRLCLCIYFRPQWHLGLCLQHSSALSPRGWKCLGLTKEAAINIRTWTAVLAVCKVTDSVQRGLILPLQFYKLLTSLHTKIDQFGQKQAPSQSKCTPCSSLLTERGLVWAETNHLGLGKAETKHPKPLSTPQGRGSPRLLSDSETVGDKLRHICRIHKRKVWSLSLLMWERFLV